MHLALRFSFAIGLLLASAGTAVADLYKYTKPDGTTAYTDQLGELPAERRAYYNKAKAEKEQRRREEESRVGKEELARREAESKKAELQRAQMDESERRQKMAALDAQIAAFQEKRRATEADRTRWQQRMKAAKERLAGLLKEFDQARETYEGLATRASFTLLPGQNEEMEKAKEKMDQLEPAIDAAIAEVEDVIPDEARRAGVPPGWIRD